MRSRGVEHPLIESLLDFFKNRGEFQLRRSIFTYAAERGKARLIDFYSIAFCSWRSWSIALKILEVANCYWKNLINRKALAFLPFYSLRSWSVALYNWKALAFLLLGLEIVDKYAYPLGGSAWLLAVDRREQTSDYETQR